MVPELFYFKVNSPGFIHCFMIYEKCAMCEIQLLVKDRLLLVIQ